MLSRIRKSMDEKDQGFTLIELLVVIIIIGILAAIAIPVFLNQREKATESSMKSDLRTVANEAETYFIDNQTYVGFTLPASVSLSSGNTVNIDATNLTATEFCIDVQNAGVNGGNPAFKYESAGGGIGDGAC